MPPITHFDKPTSPRQLFYRQIVQAGGVAQAVPQRVAGLFPILSRQVSHLQNRPLLPAVHRRNGPIHRFLGPPQSLDLLQKGLFQLYDPLNRLFETVFPAPLYPLTADCPCGLDRQAPAPGQLLCAHLYLPLALQILAQKRLDLLFLCRHLYTLYLL